MMTVAGADEFVGQAPKSATAKEITELLVKLGHLAGLEHKQLTELVVAEI